MGKLRKFRGRRVQGLTPFRAWRLPGPGIPKYQSPIAESPPSRQLVINVFSVIYNWSAHSYCKGSGFNKRLVMPKVSEVAESAGGLCAKRSKERKKGYGSTKDARKSAVDPCSCNVACPVAWADCKTRSGFLRSIVVGLTDFSLRNQRLRRFGLR